MIPPLIYIVGNASSIIPDNLDQVRARHPSSEIILALASPAIVTDIEHHVELVVPLVFYKRNVLEYFTLPALDRLEIPRLFVILPNLLERQML